MSQKTYDGDKRHPNISLLTPIKPQKVYVLASNHLIYQIQAGVWPPGTRLPSERELSEMLGISRSSVRQALTTLEAIGVLYSKRGVGHFVSDEAVNSASNEVMDSLMSQGDPQELLEARRIIEPEVARLSAIYRDTDDLARLYDCINTMKAKEKTDAFDEYLEADFRFHLELAYSTHNPVISDLVEVIVERMKAPPWQVATRMIVPKTYHKNREEHTAILDAVVERKPKEARQAMLSHLASVAKNIHNISTFIYEEAYKEDNQDK